MSLGGGAEKQHLWDSLMDPCSPEVQTGSGTAWVSCGDPLGARPGPLCPTERGREGQGGQAGCRAPGRCPWAGPTGPSAPRSFSLAGRCEDSQVFSVVAPLLKAAKPRFGRTRGISQGWANASGLRAEAWGDQVKRKPLYF